MEKKIRIGDVGKAIAKASKEHGSVYWLKNQLDVLYKKIRKQKVKGKFNASKK